MATFSIVANTFSAVGLADVVCRATAELYTLIKRVSSASGSAAQLLIAVQSLATVITEVRLWVAAYKQSLFAQEDGQCVSSLIITALNDCGRQIEELSLRLAGVTHARKAWLQRITGKVAFAFSEEQIRHSLKMIIHHQTTLKGLMLVRGGHDAIILRREIGHLKANIHNIETNITSGCVHTTCAVVDPCTPKYEPDNTSKVMSALQRHEEVLQRIASQTQELRIHRISKNDPCAQNPMSTVGTDLIMRDKGGIDMTASQHDRWIDQNQLHIHESFKRWGRTKLMTSTCSVQISGSFHPEQELDGQSVVASDGYGAANITLPLMLMRGKLDETVIEHCKENQSWTSPVSWEMIPVNCRRKGHACGQCVGPEARWVLSSIRNLMRQAHASSYLAEDSTSRSTKSLAGLNLSCLQEIVSQQDCIQECVTLKPFHHQKTSTDTVGVLSIKWSSFTLGASAVDFFSFACVPDRSLGTRAKGFAVAFARVRPIATDQLYPLLHSRRAGRITTTTHRPYWPPHPSDTGREKLWETLGELCHNIGKPIVRYDQNKRYAELVISYQCIREYVVFT